MLAMLPSIATKYFASTRYACRPTGTRGPDGVRVHEVELDLLGLVVNLNQVHLTITAEQGPGNLLGNLLCAIAGLLDQTPPLGLLAQLLNRILAILG